MPKILVYGRYVLFFWVSENGEPVHVHVAVKRPASDSTKFWLTKSGGCILAGNGSDIPERDLRDLKKLVILNHSYIVSKWAEHFGQDSISFYC